MITKTYNLYTFDELDEKGKEKAREGYRNGNEYDFLSEDMTEYVNDLLKKAKINSNDIKVFYSLSYSQGDGAMIELSGTWKSYNVNVKQSGRYCHYNSKTIEITQTKNGRDANEKAYNDFNEIYVDICKQLESYGYKHIEYQDADENVDENLAINEYTFLEDGTRHD